MTRARTLLLSLAFAGLSPALAVAGDSDSKVRDIRHDRKAVGLYVVFCARESPGAFGFPGHAYVVLGRDDEEKQLCAIEAFGFQPANQEDTGIVKAVPGTVVEPLSTDPNRYEVSEPELLRGLTSVRPGGALQSRPSKRPASEQKHQCTVPGRFLPRRPLLSAFRSPLYSPPPKRETAPPRPFL